MPPALAAILIAQFRILRNHLPRAGFASVLGHLLSLAWYALAATVAFGLAVLIPSVPLAGLQRWLAPALLGIFAYWQIIPLFTLSTGWSLQLNKLQIYPISNGQMFFLELILRITGSPEMLLILLGGTVGLMRHPALPPLAPLTLLLFIPFNLFLSLAVREILLHSFKRNRFREIFAIILISLSVLPQVMLRGGFAERLRPYLEAGSRGRLTPWHAEAMLTLGQSQIVDLLVLTFWTVLTFVVARGLFMRSLTFEETAQPAALAAIDRRRFTGKTRAGWSSLLYRFFEDPLATLIEKELRSLVRTPRFRIRFGMACIFSVLIFVPLAANTSRAGSNFLDRNFFPVTTLYGLLLLSDAVILNVFGTDRAAAALYFVAPIHFASVLRAKNIVAVICASLQAAIVLAFTAVLRHHFEWLDAVSSFGSSAVVGVFFLAVGNLTSVSLAWPSDPKQMLRRTAGGRLQLWVLGCSVGMAILIGAALLARWALDSYWAFVGVLGIELVVAAIVYKVATDTALERSLTERERMMDQLSKSAAVIGSSG